MGASTHYNDRARPRDRCSVWLLEDRALKTPPARNLHSNLHSVHCFVQFIGGKKIDELQLHQVEDFAV